MTLKDLEKVLYFESYVVIEPGLTPLKQHQLLNEEEFIKAQDEYGEEAFTATIGAEAMQKMLLGDQSRGRASERLRAEMRDDQLRGQAQEAGQAAEAGRGLHRVRTAGRNG